MEITLRKVDIMVVSALFLLLLTHIITVAISVKESQTTGADYRDVVTLIEANPVAKWILINHKINSMLSIIIMPSIVFGTYFYYRKKLPLDTLIYYGYVVLTMAAININNDIGVYLGQMLR